MRLCLLLLAACASARPAAPAVEENAPLGKLPADVAPSHYALALTIDPDQPRFSGEAEIAVTLQKPRSVIWLHGNDLHVTKATVNGADARYEQVNPDGVAKLTLAEPVSGEATLRIAWDAPFNPHLRGLYLSKADGRSYASTHFEEISARYAFPSFDEPRFKTPFDVTITGPAQDVIVSNTLPAEERASGATKTVKFHTTKPLPTYLVLFGVGPWDEVRADVPPNEIRKTALPMRLFAPKGRAKDLAYAARSAGPLLASLERYFGSEYPFEKLDHICVPDFEAGAMENAGAITYREQFLLYDEAVSSPSQKTTIADGLAHEMAHQWFGDAVTMAWWDDIWLNEAFASWLAPKVVDAWDPALADGLELFDRASFAMGTDSLRTARKIRQPIETVGDIQNAFDGLTYYKGAMLLTMFERFVGEEKFRDGIRAYVDAHRYGTGTTDELMAALSKSTGRDVKTAFGSFIDQEGVPLVEAAVDCSAKPAVSLRQSRYLPLGSQASRDRVWQVPVCVRTDAGTSCTLLTQAAGSLALDRCPRWIMPNAGAAGYYRWSLAPKDLAALRDQGYASLDVRERVSLARAVFAAVRSGSLPAGDALAIAPLFAKDENGAVALQPLGFLQQVEQDFVDGTDRDAALRFANALYLPVVQRLGWQPRPGESKDTRALRHDALAFLALVSREPQVRAEAVRRGRAFAGGDEHAVTPQLAGIALEAAMRDGDAAFYDTLEQRFFAAQDEVVRGRFLAALAAAQDPMLVDRALSLTLDPRSRENERGDTIFVSMSFPSTRELAWRWVQSHLDPLAKTLGDRGMAFLPAVGGAFCDAEHAVELKATFEPQEPKYPALTRVLANTVERISLCTELAHAQRASAAAFLRKVD